MTVTCAINTRYPECDRMGVVHHAVYPIWYEQARLEWLERAGLRFEELSALGVNPAMVDLHIKYKGAATYPQTLYITVRPESFAPKKLGLSYTLTDASGVLLGEAETFHIWTGPDNRSFDLERGLPEMYARLKAAFE
ncbi:MAG: acyl-CoA thioesterase [Oscillospiraceae bacterium]|nr:acyl-CoA thioesterase [Oscillospiraceae bacterium]